MAFRLLRVYDSFIKPFKQSLLSTNCINSTVNNEKCNFLKVHSPTTCLIRSASFFGKNSGATLWKSVISVSNAGKNRGRGRGTRKPMNLNKGQYIGVGKINMLWPGLTGPLMSGRAVTAQKRLPDDPEREAKIIQKRIAGLGRRSRRIHPLERGWTSAKMGGRSLGPPDPVLDETFDGFDTKVIEHKIVSHMTGNMGRKRNYSSFVITGNNNGLVGIATGKSTDGRAALKVARNRAGAKLMHVPLYNNHTVYHDLFAQFGKTKLFVMKKPEGYGLVCHRAIKCACQVIGIKDLHAKVEGSMTYQHIIKAFLIALLKQKTHQELAEKKRLYLVEMRKENLFYPKVVATPKRFRKNSEIPSTEIMDFTQYVLGGKLVLKKKYIPPFYHNFNSYKNRQSKLEYVRNQDKVKIRLWAEHGELKSFLADKYPECNNKYKIQKPDETVEGE